LASARLTKVGSKERSRPVTSVPIARGPVSGQAALMASTDEKAMTERARAEERVRVIVEELDRPTLALLYKTLHDALGFRIETVDIAIGKLRR